MNQSPGKQLYWTSIRPWRQPISRRWSSSAVQLQLRKPLHLRQVLPNLGNIVEPFFSTHHFRAKSNVTFTWTTRKRTLEPNESPWHRGAATEEVKLRKCVNLTGCWWSNVWENHRRSLLRDTLPSDERPRRGRRSRDRLDSRGPAAGGRKPRPRPPPVHNKKNKKKQQKSINCSPSNESFALMERSDSIPQWFLGLLHKS